MKAIGTFWKGTMDRKQILELALEALERQRTETERAIAEIKEFQDGRKRISASNPEASTLVVVNRRSRTAAQRRAQALRMRKYWAKKRDQAGKPSATRKKQPSAKVAKVRAWTDAEKKALSLKLKKAWKKRKAASAKNATAKTTTVKASGNPSKA